MRQSDQISATIPGEHAVSANKRRAPADFSVGCDAGIVTFRVAGPITTAVGDELMHQALQALREQRAHGILYDLRRARIGESTLQLIRRPRYADEIGIPATTRVGLLCSMLSTEYAMLVNLARTRGHALRAFTDGAAALDWLRRDSEPRGSGKVQRT